MVKQVAVLKSWVKRYRRGVALQRNDIKNMSKSLNVSKKLKLRVRKRLGAHRGSRGILKSHSLELVTRQGHEKNECIDYLNATFMVPTNLAAASACLDLSERSVRRMRSITAKYVLDHQLLVLGQLVMLASVHPPLFIVTREAWDETSQ